MRIPALGRLWTPALGLGCLGTPEAKAVVADFWSEEASVEGGCAQSATVGQAVEPGAAF